MPRGGEEEEVCFSLPDARLLGRRFTGTAGGTALGTRRFSCTDACGFRTSSASTRTHATHVHNDDKKQQQGHKRRAHTEKKNCFGVEENSSIFGFCPSETKQNKRNKIIKKKTKMSSVSTSPD